MIVKNLITTLEPYVLKSAIKHFSQKYGLDPAIIYGICQTESALNPNAIRYEPAFYKKYIEKNEDVLKQASKIKGVSVQTELRARAFSFGIMQVMGQVARENGFTGVFLTDLCRTWTGIQIGSKVFAKKLKKYPNMVEAISSYNAGRPTPKNQKYVDKVLRFSKEWT